MTNEEACESISNIILDYRDGEFGAYDSRHVERWASQFDECERTTVLKETNRLLKKTFISKDSFLKLINSLIDSDSVYIDDKDRYWKGASSLNIQINGNSQVELNELFCSEIYDRYGVTDLVGKDSKDYIYLDDFIFSGNRLYRDMEVWMQDAAPRECRVCIITLGWYVYGQWNTGKRLKQLAKDLGKNITFVFFSYKPLRLENRLWRKDNSEIFWPTESVTDLKAYPEFLASENFAPKFRVVNGEKNRVFSRKRREEYEKIMLKYGLKIMSFPENNSPVVKPLGYSAFSGFGFGATMFSFRNCPNNSPLAFWWGDPTARSSHPFSKWYPLLQRKAYG